MAEDRRGAETGRVIFIWVATLATLAGALVAVWLVVAWQNNLFNEPDPGKEQLQRAADACLGQVVGLFSAHAGYNPAVTLDGLITRAREAKTDLGVLEDARFVTLNVEQSEDDPDAGAATPLLLAQPEPNAACFLQLSSDPGGVTITALSAIPFDGALEPGEALRLVRLRRHVSRRVEWDLTTSVIAVNSARIAEDARVLGSGGLITARLRPPHHNGTAGCVCGPRSIGQAPPIADCPVENCAPPATVPYPGLRKPPMDRSKPETWRSLPGDVAAEGCSLYARGTDVFIWDTTDVADGCASTRADHTGGPCTQPAPDGGVEPAACPSKASACWKVVARLDGQSDPAFAAGAPEQSVVTNGFERFSPLESKPIPNVTDVSARWSRLCGGCPHCDGRSLGALSVDEHGAWRFDRPCGGAFPARVTLFFENEAGRRMTVARDSECRREVPLATTVVANASVELLDHASLTSAGPGLPALQAGGRCFLGRDVRVAGDVRCETIQVRAASSPGATVLSGDLQSWEHCDKGRCLDNELAPEGWEKCGTPFPRFDCNDPGICVGANVEFRGDAFTTGDICLGPHVVVDGSVWADDDVGVLDDTVISGRVVGGDNVGLGARVIVQPGKRPLPAVLTVK